MEPRSACAPPSFGCLGMLPAVPLAWTMVGVLLGPAAPSAPVALPRDLRVTWNAPASCPRAADVRAHAEARLSGRVYVTGANSTEGSWLEKMQ